MTERERPGPTIPTEAEDAAITAAAESDPDAWLLTDEAFARMRPAAEVLPDLVRRWRMAKGTN